MGDGSTTYRNRRDPGGAPVASRAQPLACLVAIAAAAALLPRAGGASVVRALSLEELVRASSAVVIGVPGAPVAGRDARGRIVRRVPFAVERRVIGEVDDNLTVTLLGGELEGAGTWVPGEAELPEGEESLLFLEPVPGSTGELRVTGMAQGRFSIETVAATGERCATRELAAPRMATDGAVGGTPGEACFPLESLVRKIREIGDRLHSPGE
ncbi:MAG: hypothetical protein R6V85_08055 [Polyangia bacterium]